MSRIRTTRQARNLRPIAIERARQSRFHPGDRVFYRGIAWAHVEIAMIMMRKPYNQALFIGRSAAFAGSMAEVYPAEWPDSHRRPSDPSSGES